MFKDFCHKKTNTNDIVGLKTPAHNTNFNLEYAFSKFTKYLFLQYYTDYIVHEKTQIQTNIFYQNQGATVSTLPSRNTSFLCTT